MAVPSNNMEGVLNSSDNSITSDAMDGNEQSLASESTAIPIARHQWYLATGSGLTKEERLEADLKHFIILDAEFDKKIEFLDSFKAKRDYILASVQDADAMGELEYNFDEDVNDVDEDAVPTSLSDADCDNVQDKVCEKIKEFHEVEMEKVNDHGILDLTTKPLATGNTNKDVEQAIFVLPEIPKLRKNKKIVVKNISVEKL